MILYYICGVNYLLMLLFFFRLSNIIIIIIIIIIANTNIYVIWLLVTIVC